MENKFFIPNYIHELLTASRQGTEQLTRKLSLLTNNPIVITDPLYHILSSSVKKENIHINEVLSIQKQLRNSEETIFRCQVTIQHKEVKGIATKIQVGNNTLGYLILILIHENGELDIEDYEPVLTYASSLYAFNFERRIEIKHEKQKSKAVFLYNLLYGNLKQKVDIIDYGQLWGWDFNIPHVVAVFSIKEFDYFVDDKQWINSLLEIIERTLIVIKQKPITLVKEDEVITILPICTDAPTAVDLYLTDIISSICKRTEETHLEERIACGIGTVYQNPTDIFRSYQEAKIAYDLGLLLDVHVPFFTKLGIERILYKHDVQDLNEFYHHTLGELERYDEINKSDFIDILDVFTSNQFDMTKTSEQLYLHRNTLRYRIKKIEEILNCKLDDMNTRLNILAAFKIRKLKKM